MTTKTLPDSTTAAYYYSGSGVTLVNTGTQGRPGASGINFGFVVSGNNDTLINNGTVFGQRVGVYITGSGDTVINAAQKNITATEARQGGINFYNFSGTVTNYGTISGYAGATNGNGGNAVELRHGGLVTNFGTLLNGGALFRLAPGTLVNSGVVLGNVAYGGVYMEAGGTVTNLAGGLISANGATSSYAGAPPYGVFIHGAAGTITNAGTIDGGSGNAVLLAAGFQNRVIVDPGAAFVGTVNGGTAVDATLELASAASQGTLSGIGSQYINFGTVAFDSAASWLVKANTSIASATIIGFGATDTIDLSGFLAVSDTFSANTLVLTNASSAQVTLHMQGTFATANFTIANDGDGGTDLGFTTLTPAALVYGQTIDETGIVATIETVSAGVMTLFNGGGTAVGTISVGTSLATGDFTLRSDGSGGTDVIVDTVFGIYEAGVTLLTNPTTIASTASVNDTIGAALSSPGGANWSITNYGVVNGTANANGVRLGNGGTLVGGSTITNEAGGVIRGRYGIMLYNGTNDLIINLAGATIAAAGTTADRAVDMEDDPGVVVNAGLIISQTGGVFDVGVELDGGGSLTNTATGTITGGWGVLVSGAGTVTNAGTISGAFSGEFAVALNSGDRLIVDPGAVFVGAVNGGRIGGSSTLELASATSAGTLAATNFTNFSTIAFDAGAAWTLQGSTTALSGSIFGFTLGDTIDLTGFAAVSRTFAGNTLVLTNAGGTHQTLQVEGNLVSGNFALSDDGDGGTDIVFGSAPLLYGQTIDEAGIVAATETVSAGVMTLFNGGGTAVGTIAVGGTLNTSDFTLAPDGASGTDVIVSTIFGTYTSIVTVLSNPTTIASTASISGTVSGIPSLYGPAGTAWTVTNEGTIHNSGDSTFGVSFAGGGMITNAAGGVVYGHNGGIAIHGTGASVLNLGQIQYSQFGPGIILENGGTVINGQAGGTASSASISGYNYGVQIQSTGAAGEIGSVVNYGTIDSRGGKGVSLVNGAFVNGPSGATGAVVDAYVGVCITESGTVINFGSIAYTGGGNGNYGILMVGAGTVGNAGLIEAQIGIEAHADAFVLNAGTIISTGGTSGVAIQFAAGTNLLVAEPDAVFVGSLSAAGTTTLELAQGAGTGVLAGFGTYVTNFTSLVFDAGAQWTVAGDDSDAGLGTLGIGGFTLGDTIDLTGFAAVSSTFASNTLVLTDAGGGHGTLSIQGSFVSGNFHLSSDGDGGTDIVFGAPPLLYGETIDEIGIIATSETVTAGVMTLFTGINPVGTIAVGTTLDTGDFTLRPNGPTATDVIVSTVFGTYTSSVTLLTNPTTIAGTASITGSGTGETGVIGPSGTTWTLVNQGLIDETGTASQGISFASAGTITNATGGVIEAATTGIRLNAGGSVTNQSGGTISGKYGIYALGATATVVNAGTISANPTTSFAILLTSGGTVTNLASGRLSGLYGVRASGVAATVVNSGSIGNGTSYSTGEAVALRHGGLVTNLAGGRIIASREGVYVGGGASTIVNAGTIGAGLTLGNGIVFATTGAITNQSGGVITAQYAIRADDSTALTIVNAGSIYGNMTVGRGVYANSAGSLTNQSGGTITGLKAVEMTGGSVTNAGGIGGNTALATGVGVELVSGGSFTNQSGGTVTGFTGVYGAATVVNAGGIYGNMVSGRGVSLAAGGSVNNLTTGLITGFDGVFAAGGATVVNAGSIGGSNAVIFGSGAANRLVFDPGAVFSGLVDGGNAIGATAASTLELAPSDDAGTLSGLGTQFIHFAQVVVDAGARWTLSTANTLVAGVTLTNAGSLTATGTLQNAGTIIGTGGTTGNYGIVIAAAGTLGNLGTASLIQGYDGVLVGAGGTVTNAGTIGSTHGIDGVALRFTGGTARLIDDPGAVFAGTVNGDDSATLELASAASAGVITGLGASVTNFASLVFDSGAQWTVAGNDAPGGLGTLGIGGFTIGDTIDLTSFAAVSETFASNALVLTNGIGSHESLNIQGAFATDNFLIGNDGDGGTDITFVIPPTIAAAGTVIFTGGGSAVTLDSTLSITDPTGTMLVAGTVSIGGFLAGDTLNFSNQNGIVGNFDTATGTLTLTGSATVADYQAALDSITYGFDPTDGDPTAGGDTMRTINWVVNDGTVSSPLATSTLDTEHVAPTITAGGTVSFTGGGGSVVLDSSLTLADVDSGGLLNGGTVSITGFVSGDILSVDTIGTSITASFDALTGVLTLSGSDTLADYQTVLRGITYSFNPADGDPTGGGSETSRTIDWLVTDGATANAVSNTGTSTLDTVHVGPTITAAGTVAYVADGTATVLDSAVAITDIDSTGAIHAATVSIGGGFTVGDLLNFTTQNGIIGNYDTATGTLTLSGDATIGDYQTALDSITYTFTPDGGDPTAAGTDPTRTITWTVNDGVDTSAAASSTLDLSLPPPVITGATTGQTTTDEATIDPFSAVSVTDPNSDQTETITITVTNGGTLTDADGTLSGTGLTRIGTGTYTLTAGSTDAVTAELDALVFTPTIHQVAPGGSVTTGFTLAVTDTLNQSATDSTTSVVATAVNDPPVITGAVSGQATTDETTLSPFSSITINDVDVGQTETVTVSLSNAANGTLSNLDGGSYDSGTGVYSVTGTDAAVTTALDGLVFTPTAHQVPPGGSVATTFTIAATDTAGGTQSNNTTTVIVTAVNDQPVITGAVAGQATTDETTLSPFSGVAISDIDVGQTETVTVTLSDAANGILSNLDGGSYDSGTGVYSVTGSDTAVTTALDGLIFTPTAHQAPPGGSVATTFTIATTDTAGGTASNSTTTVTATADNDPPVITGTVSGQRMSNNATIQPFSGVTISDPDAGASETVTITLTYGGTPTDVYGTLSGADLTKTGNGIYTLATGSPGAVTAELDALIFTPIPDSVVPDRTITTGMTLSVTDGIVGTPATDTTTSVNSIACFTAGTRIATPRGTVAVERLREGDMILTVSGKPRPVQWIGRRTLDCDRHIAPERVKPVRIAPHAFGEDRPRRALLLSPDHSIFIEDVMIPIKHLINGATITQIDVSTVTYYHIELESHDVVLAEGLPAETYLETGGRAAFENGGGAIALHPDFAPDENRVGMVWRNFAYAPLIGSDGQLNRVRARLTLQAAMLMQQTGAPARRTKRPRRKA